MAARHGFIYHHARGEEAVLCKWLVEDEESKLPLYSNHTVGVAGMKNYFPFRIIIIYLFFMKK